MYERSSQNSEILKVNWGCGFMGVFAFQSFEKTCWNTGEMNIQVLRSEILL